MANLLTYIFGSAGSIDITADSIFRLFFFLLIFEFFTYIIGSIFRGVNR